jgi:DNA-binding transcriptional LysR family regulator
MNYTLHQLNIFLKIVQTGSITKASEALHLTQPAVSIQLKNFQDQFDIPLTEVVGRKLYVTEFGKEIAISAEQILHQVYEINFKTMAYKGQLTGRLKISVVSTGKYVMPYFLTDFIQNNPGVELEMDVTNKIRVLKSLEKNEVDFSLVSILPENMPVQHIDLMENTLYLVGKKGHFHVKKRNWQEMFEEYPVIFREKGSGTRHTMEQFILQSGLKVTKKMELTSNEAVKQAILAGLGMSIMPVIGIRTELKLGMLEIIPVKVLPIRTNWSLIWPGGKKNSPVARAFLEYITSHKENIIEKYFPDNRLNS